MTSAAAESEAMIKLPKLSIAAVNGMAIRRRREPRVGLAGLCAWALVFEFARLGTERPLFAPVF